MSNNILTSPVGIDASIQKVQVALYSYLSSRWTGTITGYGKAYVNESKDSKKLEWYNASEQDYQDVYFDDNSDATFFFIEGDRDTTTDEIVFVSEVKCVFMVNLTKILSQSGRQDAQAQRDAVEALRSMSNVFQVNGLEKTIDTVFSRVDIEKIKFNDMQPLHCFAVLLTLNYYLTDKCT